MSIFAKLFVMMVALGAMGLALLSLRQQRYEVSNEISRAHNRIVEQERGQWRLRASIAGRSDPADIRSYAERLKLDLAPIQESAEASTATLATPSAAELGGKSPAPTEPAASKNSAAPPKKSTAKKPGSATKSVPSKGAAPSKGNTRGH